MGIVLDTDIRYLKGVGEKRVETYAKLGVYTIGDLLYHLPKSYIDLTSPVDIAAAALGETCTIRAELVRKLEEVTPRKGLSVYRVLVTDGVTDCIITFFNNKYAPDSLKSGEKYFFHGKITGGLLRKEMSSPLIFPASEDFLYSPIYPLTAGISSRTIIQNVRQALSLVGDTIPDLIPEFIRKQYGLCSISEALRQIHRPTSARWIIQARKRLVFEELFILTLGLGQLSIAAKSTLAPCMSEKNLDPFYQALPFTPTGAQKRAIEQATADLCRSTPMNRLIQGDVGSGKTLVAAACAYFTCQNGLQAALMAPTELLAQQHYAGLSKLLAPLGVQVGLLTGSMTAAQKRTLKTSLADGSTELCIGTHALLSADVAFSRLALVITDEQHRFGVAQRTSLQDKGEHPHVLVMSATPIPRTLALMIYGELDLSVIDELPPNRQVIKTYRISSGKRERAFGFIRQHLDAGRQAYIVCPLIEQGEIPANLKTASDYAGEIANKAFVGYRVGLLHGKMKAGEKEQIMREFKEGTLQLLVSTTVIEVGVDVPNAVIMMIENAERFGLSQLHQLRGRVGRGTHQSHCILLTDNRSPDTLSRIDMLCRSGDGFEIARYDLETRGPGTFLGHQQHGLPELKLADFSLDMGLMQNAQDAAHTLLALDGTLSSPDHLHLSRAVSRLLKNVGERPN